MDGCLANLLKYLLFGSNFIIFVIGCVVLGLGIYALVDGASLVDLVEQSEIGDINITAFTSAAYIFIVVAVFVVVLTFFGCCGAIKESKCMLGTYFVLILVMFIIMIVGAVLGYSTSMDKLQGALEKTMTDYRDDIDSNPTPAPTDKQKAVTAAWDEVQQSLKCCGTYLNGTGDDNNSWEGKGPYPIGDFLVPKSCCEQFAADKVDVCRKNPQSADLPEKVTGCFDKLESTFNDNKSTFLIAGVVVMVIMFLNMLFAFAMCTMAN